MSYEFRNDTYRSLHVASVAGTARFEDGVFSTEDKALGEALAALPDWYGVQLVSAPDEPAEDPDEGPNDPPGDGEGDGSGPDDVQRPARSASKADWLAYARAVDPDATLDDLTKEQLVETYGGEG